MTESKTKKKKQNKKRRFSQDFSGESKTQQHFAASHDVNNIINHFRVTGIDPYAERQTQQTFGYASSKSFSDAMQNVTEVQSAFAELPAHVRRGFSDDPARWLDHITKPPQDEPPFVDPEPSEAPSSPAELATTNQRLSDEMDST